jgi:threonine dehydrogenase-like Zn-dependent dehydrogenase
MGLLLTQVARAAGAESVIVTEVAPTRISRARKLGFIALDAANERCVSQVIELTQGRAADVV